jgi:hypothetical protein
MNSPTQLEIQVLPISKLVVKGEDGNTTEYSLVMDFEALAKAEPLLSKTQDLEDKKGKVISKSHTRDLSSTTDWLHLTSADLSVICWAAFSRYHEDVTLKQVRRWLGPATQNDLFTLLFEASYPGVLEKLVAESKKKKKDEDDESPNVEAAVAEVSTNRHTAGANSGR